MHEIERKYIVDPASPALHRALTTAGSGEQIRQGYVIAAGATGELRLRSRNGRHTMTVKRGTPPLREEYEVDMPTELFEQLWPATDGCRVKKRRWHIRYGELDVELDAFDGAFARLVVGGNRVSEPAGCQACRVRRVTGLVRAGGDARQTVYQPGLGSGLSPPDG